MKRAILAARLIMSLALKMGGYSDSESSSTAKESKLEESGVAKDRR